MKSGLPAVVLTATLLAAPFAGLAQQPAADPHGHDTTTASPTKSESSTQAMRTMDEHMNKMQSLHERMAKATTPGERQKLMEEARKEMHEGMASMGPMMQGGMGGRGMGGKGASADAGMRMQMMEKRMDMMQMMMQMMMDRQESTMPATPGATKP